MGSPDELITGAECSDDLGPGGKERHDPAYAKDNLARSFQRDRDHRSLSQPPP